MLKKQLLTVLIATSLLTTTLVPISAESNDDMTWISTMMEESDELANNLDEIGFTTTDLLEIASLPKKPQSFYSTKANYAVDKDVVELIESLDKVVDPFKPSDYELTNSTEDKNVNVRAPYDVNPPLNEQEQRDRILYLTKIIQTEYYQDRYQDKIGNYYLYLYTSHWTENSNFVRGGDNYFDKIYANIISQNDIDAFDSFYDLVQKGAVTKVFVNLGSTISTIKDAAKGDLNKIEKYIEAIKYSKYLLGDKEEAFTKSMSDQGIDTTTAIDITREMIDIYKANYADVQTSENMIKLINDQMNQYGLSGYTTTLFVDLTSSIIMDTVLTGLSIPFICSGVYYFKVLSDIYPMVTLAGLYYSYSIRRADRLAIYLGLFDRP